MDDRSIGSNAPSEPPPDDDRTLVASVRAGEPQGVRLLIERYQPSVFGLCLRMLRHRQDAEDVVQDTFLRAIRAIGRFDGDRPLRPWLLGIAANRCRTALGKRARGPRLSDALDLTVEPDRPSERPRELVEELERALLGLRPDYRMVFILYHDQNLSYEAIAEVVGRPVGTIKTWLHRARAQMAVDLKRRGVRCSG